VISAVFKTRHGRDLALLIVLGIGLSGFIGQGMIREAIGRLGTGRGVLATGSTGSPPCSPLLPPNG
jgi:hypothetical protein